MTNRQKSKFNIEVNEHQSLHYYQYNPTGSKNKLPLVLFLHGRGERGDNLDLVETHGIPKLIKEGKSFPFITIAPQCPLGTWWSDPEAICSLSSLMDKIITSKIINKSQIYCTGLSMGGYGTLALSIKRPELFAAVAPVCGGLDERIFFHLDKIKDLPIWMFHGDEDDVIPVSKSERVFEGLRQKNKQVKLTKYRGVGHNAWDRTYQNQELYNWILKHKK